MTESLKQTIARILQTGFKVVIPLENGSYIYVLKDGSEVTLDRDDQNEWNREHGQTR